MIVITIKILVLLIIFILGELLVNNTIFRYIKKYFDSTTKEVKKPNIIAGAQDQNAIAIEQLQENPTKEKLFLGFNISTFKGMLERFALYLAMVMNITQILIVFGTLKIGSRITTDPKKILNDYFIVGNFVSILISFGYMYCYNKTINVILEFLKPYYS